MCILRYKGRHDMTYNLASEVIGHHFHQIYQSKQSDSKGKDTGPNLDGKTVKQFRSMI